MTAETITKTTAPVTAPDIDTSALTEIEERVILSVSLGDLIRRGSTETTQADGWGSGGEACALSAAALDARSLGLIG
jgi:hypothetical protein